MAGLGMSAAGAGAVPSGSSDSAAPPPFRTAKSRCNISSVVGYPNDPLGLALIDTKYFWVSPLGIYSKIIILGTGSLG